MRTAALATGAAIVLGGLFTVGYYVVFAAPGASPDTLPTATAEVVVPTPPPTASANAQPSASASPPVPPPPPLLFPEEQPTTREEQHEAIFKTLAGHYALDKPAMDKVREIFAGSKRIGQGHPTASEHPMTKKECLDIRAKAELPPTYSEACGSRYMVPIYNPKAKETEKDARVCIDQFEFPGVPCEYPVTWVTAREAAQLCEAVGKRLCDAHEWEGACAGAVLPVEDEYHFKLERKYAKGKHNEKREEVWAYGPAKDHKKCGTGSKKSDKCGDGGKCGSNTYPAGAFPECVSSFGVYDQHGNAAEHMNLPMNDKQLASSGNYGETEMKGSWFIFQSYEAHIDDCRWRAPDWHATEVMSHNSHANYHLGFRCCKDLETK